MDLQPRGTFYLAKCMILIPVKEPFCSAIAKRCLAEVTDKKNPGSKTYESNLEELI
jgi:hypothetical protein